MKTFRITFFCSIIVFFSCNYNKKISNEYIEKETLENYLSEQTPIQEYNNGTKDSIYVDEILDVRRLYYFNSNGYNKIITLDSRGNLVRQFYLLNTKKLALVNYSGKNKIEDISYFYVSESDTTCDISLNLKLNIDGNIVEERYGKCVTKLIEREDEYGVYSVPETIWAPIVFKTNSFGIRIGNVQ